MAIASLNEMPFVSSHCSVRQTLIKDGWPPNDAALT